MPVPSIKYPLSLIILPLLVVTVFLSAGQHLQAGTILGLILMMFVLAATTYTILKAHRLAYQQGKLSLFASIRNPCLEIAGILLAMFLAGLLGKAFTQAAIRFVGNDLTKTIAGILIGLLVGILMGVLIQKGTRRLMQTLPGETSQDI